MGLWVAGRHYKIQYCLRGDVCLSISTVRKSEGVKQNAGSNKRSLNKNISEQKLDVRNEVHRLVCLSQPTGLLYKSYSVLCMETDITR